MPLVEGTDKQTLTSSPLTLHKKHIGDEQNQARASSSFGGSQREREREKLTSLLSSQATSHTLSSQYCKAEHSSLSFFFCAV